MSRVSIPKKLRRQLYFSRPELSQILAAYSARVAAGEWRDYAIDHLAGSATFSIFRHTHENPLFVIEKKQRHPKEAPQFILRDRNRVLVEFLYGVLVEFLYLVLKFVLEIVEAKAERF